VGVVDIIFFVFRVGEEGSLIGVKNDDSGVITVVLVLVKVFDDCERDRADGTSLTSVLRGTFRVREASPVFIIRL
jgi:hypothetical protein